MKTYKWYLPGSWGRPGQQGGVGAAGRGLTVSIAGLGCWKHVDVCSFSNISGTFLKPPTEGASEEENDSRVVLSSFFLRLNNMYLVYIPCV